MSADVRLHPFHATSAALPELPDGAWADMISSQPDGDASGQNRTAAILLAEPHFLLVRPTHAIFDDILQNGKVTTMKCVWECTCSI